MGIELHFGPVLAERDILLRGIWLTVTLSASAIILGSALAILLVATRSLGSKFFQTMVDCYVELLRNTPFLVQLVIIFFGLPTLGLRLSGVEAALLAMVLNLAAYATEIMRAGVEATHRSQLEAGASLAMTPLQVFRHVVLIPALAKVWPALSSQFVLMFLASSIVSFISVEELSGAAAIIEQQTFRSFETYIVVTIIYLILALALKAVLSWFGRLVFPKVSGIVYRQVGAGA
jgi:polar amino acid transport system permease protein